MEILKIYILYFEIIIFEIRPPSYHFFLCCLQSVVLAPLIQARNKAILDQPTPPLHIDITGHIVTSQITLYYHQKL